MFERSEDPAFCRRVGVGSEVLKEMVVEFSAAARRVDIAERIASFIRQNNSPSEPVDAIARKISLVAERRINRFVAQLDLDALDAAAQRQAFGEDLREPVFLPRKLEFDTADMALEARTTPSSSCPTGERRSAPPSRATRRARAPAWTTRGRTRDSARY